MSKKSFFFFYFFYGRKLESRPTIFQLCPLLQRFFFISWRKEPFHTNSTATTISFYAAARYIQQYPVITLVFVLYSFQSMRCNNLPLSVRVQKGSSRIVRTHMPYSVSFWIPPVSFHYPENKSYRGNVLMPYIHSFYFRLHNGTGEIQRNTLFVLEHLKCVHLKR